MNRRREYDALLQELDRPAAEDAVAAAFVLLVNFSAPVARACAGVPVLKELAHEGAQFVGQTQEENGVSMYVDSLIVDQKRLTVFFRVDTDIAPKALMRYGLRDAEGYIDERFTRIEWQENEMNVPNGQMRSTTIDFGRDDVPEELFLEFGIYLRMKGGRPLTEDDIYEWDTVQNLGKEEAVLSFHLNIEPGRRVQGYEKHFAQELLLADQVYAIEAVNIYSSKAEICMKGREANTAWLQSLEFYLECEDGTIRRPNRTDILWEGGVWSKERKYYCESPYYHMPSGKVKLVITGATLLDKGHRRGGVNLRTGELTDMPEWIEFGSVREEDGCTVLRLYKRDFGAERHGIFMGGYATAPEENEPDQMWVDYAWGDWMQDGESIGRYCDYYLNPDDLDGDWICMPLSISRYWQPDQPVEIELQMD